MAISAEQLNIILSARDKEFTKAMTANQKRVERFAKNSQKSLSKASKGFDALAKRAKAVAPVLAAAFSINAIKGVVDATAEIGTLADVAGVSATRFQELAFASSNFGIEQDKLSDILKDVNDKFGDYEATGAGPLADFFENIAPKVGLTADAFRDLSSEQKLGKYVNALEAAGVSTQEMTFYLEALASDATLLEKVFRDNGSELDRMSKKLRDAGGVMEASLIADAREAKEELAIASQVIKANLNVALAELIPLLVGGAEAAAKVAKNIGIAYSAVHEFLNPTAILEKSIDNVVLAMADEIRQSRQLNIQLEKSKDMTVEMAEEKLEEAKARNANAVAAIAEARALVMASPAYNRLIERLGLLREQQIAISQPTESGESRNSRTSEAYENLSLSIRDTHNALASLLDTDIALEDQIKQTSGNIAILEEALAKARDGMVSFGNGIIEPIEKTERLSTATTKTKASLQDLIDQLDLSGVALEAFGLGANATQENLEGLQSVIGTLDQAMEDGFMSMVDGTTSFKDAVRNMARDVIKELYRVLVVQRLVAGVKTAFRIPDVSATTGNAHGGTVQAGVPTTVGEHGREVFVPQTAGRILSVPQAKAAAGGGDSVVVNQSINVSTGVQQTVRAEVMGMMPQIAEASKAAVLDARRRGGAFAGAF